jgi:hypothetical protein
MRLICKCVSAAIGVSKQRERFMRTFAALFGFMTLSMTAAAAEIDCQCFTPTAEEIAALEQRIDASRLPLQDLGRYVRYYQGIASPAHLHSIHGKLVPRRDQGEPPIQIVSDKVPMPTLSEQGCILSAEVDGTVQLRCADPGAWTPTEAQLTELEATLPHAFKLWELQDQTPTPAASLDVVIAPDPSGIDCARWGVECRAIDWTTHTIYPYPIKHWEDRDYPLTLYSRYYAGATRDGERVIIGRLILAPDLQESQKRAIISELEWPLVLDGGCGMVSVTYHLETKSIQARCNGVR